MKLQQMRVMNRTESTRYDKSESDRVAPEAEISDVLFVDYIKFVIFSFLLLVPAYAIVKSVISNNWLMVIIDLLLVPVGFVHGLLLIFGIVD